MSHRVEQHLVGVIALALVFVPGPSRAALRDHGPVNPQTGFPTFYRDTSGTALELCLDQTTPSPNASAGGAPLCFPWVADPAGYAGNFGEEQFYSVSDALLTTPTLNASLTLALEAAYAQGTPIRGDEMVFARVRIRIDTPVAGTYRVIHPFGVEVFPDVGAGLKAINVTTDIGIAPGLFDGALAGAMGPFLEWDVLELDPASGVPYTLTVNTPDGPQVFLGDPNIPHTVKGSPFGTNFFRVEGPAGSDLDGQGNPFAETPLFTVVGKKYMKPIPTALTVERAVFTNDGAYVSVDVFARSVPSAQLVVTGAGLPTTPMLPDGLGSFFAHIVYPAAGAPPPSSISVTNLSDVPSSVVTAPLTDAVTVWNAVYDTTTGILDVAAFSSDTSGGGPGLSLLGPSGGALAPSAGNPTLRTLAVITDVPPPQVAVVSAAGGREVVSTRVITSAPPPVIAMPVALSDEVTTAEDEPVAIAVLLNDVPSAATVVLVGSAANGTASVNDVDGTLEYTPKANWSGTEVLEYMIQDPLTGMFSNTATATITVAAVNDPPDAVADAASTSQGVARTIAVLVNDADVDSTIATGTLAIAAAPSNGTAVVNPDSTVTYTPNAGFAGLDTFGYTVADGEGAVSAVGTVTVTVTSSPEQLGTSRVQYEAAKGRWRVDGSSTVFGATVSNRVTFYNGPSTAYPVIGTAVVDATGGFSWQPTPGTVPAPDATRRLTIRSTGGGQITATVVFK